jgi:ribosome-binding protein aMBF1 (putative translation factor)
MTEPVIAATAGFGADATPDGAASLPPAAAPADAETKLARPPAVVLDGRRLREARRESGLSQERLAFQAGIGLTTVRRLERQDWPPCRPRTLGRLAAALGVGPAVIFSHVCDAASGGQPRSGEAACHE